MTRVASRPGYVAVAAVIRVYSARRYESGQAVVIVFMLRKPLLLIWSLMPAIAWGCAVRVVWKVCTCTYILATIACKQTLESVVHVCNRSM